MKKLFKLLVGLFISFFVIGCGGGSGGSSGSSGGTGSSENIQTGVLSDSKVEGVTYTQGLRTGTTDSNGTFSFDKNNDTPVSFSIGMVNLGSISPSNIDNNQTIYPTDIVGVDKTETNNTKVVNMLRVLQSLDSDGNPFNGIEIDSNTTSSLAGLSQEINFDEVDENDTSILTTIVVTEANKTLLSRDYAIAHFEDTLRNDENLSINTVPPMPPIMDSRAYYTNQSYTTISIFGQKDAKVFLDGVDINKTISRDNYVDINISITTADNNYTFSTVLQDTNDRNSSESNITIVKDTISPILTISDISVNENTSITTAIATVGVNDNSPVNFALAGIDANRFSINGKTGEIRFRQSPDYEIKTSYSITIVATDFARNVSTKTIAVNINPLNDETPIFTSNVFAVEENNATVGTFSISDADISVVQTFTYTIVGGIDKDLFGISSDVLSFQNAPDFDNPADSNSDNNYLVDVNVSDGINSSVKTFTISVTPANDNAPIITSSSSASFNENASGIVLDMSHSDVDDNKPGMVQYFTYSISGTDVNYFNINSSTGELSFKNAPDYETKQSYSITAIVFDGKNYSTSQDITISINHLNDEAPSITSTNTISVNENFSGLAHTLTKSDADLDESQTFIYSISGTDASHFTIGASSGEIRFISSPDYETKKTYSILARVFDGQNYSSVQTITISINHLNDEKPVIHATFPSMYENNISVPNNILIIDNDQDETQTFTYSISGGEDASKFSITSDGNITFNSAPDYENPIDNNGDNEYKVGITVNDGVNTSDTLIYSVTIKPLNDITPVITSSDLNISENNSTVTIVTSTDGDKDQSDQVFTYSIDGGVDASKFSVTSDGNLSFNSAPDYESPTDSDSNNIYLVGVKVSDGVHTSVVKTLKIGVSPLNDISPVITSSNSVSVNENTTSTIMTLTSSDADQDQTDQVFTYSISGTDASHFSINSSTGVIAFSGVADYESKQSYSISAIVNDGENNSTTQVISVNLNPINDEIPVIVAEDMSVNENVINIMTISKTDADQDQNDQSFTYSIDGGADASKFSITSGGVLSFLSAPDYENPTDSDGNNIYVVGVKVNDGVNTSSIKTLNISIGNLDDVPTPEAFSGKIRGIVTNGSPIENVKVVIQNTNQHLMEDITDVNGSFSFDINSSFTGPYIFKAFLPDGGLMYSYNTGDYAVTNINPITSLVMAKFADTFSNMISYELFLNFSTIYSQNSNLNTLFTTSYSTNVEFLNTLMSENKFTGYNHFFNESYQNNFDYLNIVLYTLNISFYNDLVIIYLNGNVYTNIPNYVSQNTSLSGYIYDESGNAISNVLIQSNILNQLYQAYTNSSGYYTITLPNNNVIDLNMTHNSFIEYYNNISTFFATSSSNQNMEQIRIIESEGNVTLSGYVYDGRTTSTRIPSVTIKVRKGFNTKTGTVYLQSEADSSGDYSINLPKGNYTIEFSKSDWTTEYLNTSAVENVSTLNYYLTQANSNYLANNAFVTAVLTWGASPRDLDTHLLLPTNDSNTRGHIYYSKKIYGSTPSNTSQPCDTDGVIASLDVDDVSSYGPETLSVCSRYPYGYKYYIYNYSGNPDFDVSNARVSVTTASGRSQTFSVPYVSGDTKRYWHVFDVDTLGNIIPVNELKSTAPTYTE